uniref:hypothetical protein n=1 Tax=Porphyridium aerugineum TaxID=2792 RepID=UPI001FCDFF35|nr:hypothetical protein MW505_pgp180 [Porphyridium aerugineum]UNJ17817.1 hypothetical protein [Porphyridium aerugineum]
MKSIGKRLNMHYASIIKYKSYIYKPQSWLHKLPHYVKLKFIFLYCLLITCHEFSISIFYIAIILSISLGYRNKNYYQELVKLILSGIIIYSSLLLNKFFYTNQYISIGWMHTNSIVLSFISLLIFNKILNYTSSKEELSKDLYSNMKQFDRVIFIIKIGLDFLSIVEKKLLLLLYSLNNRDIKKIKLFKNTNFIKTLLNRIIIFLFLEIYHEINSFSQAIYLKNRNNNIINTKQYCNQITTSLLDLLLIVIIVVLF